MRVLFVHNGHERFVLDDMALLRQTCRVTDWYQPRRHFSPFRLYRLVRSHDLVFSWFASWHSLAPVWLARRMGKPAITVVGGYDTAAVPEAEYGSQRGGIRRLVGRAVMRRSSCLIAISCAARAEAIANAGAAPNKLTVIYPGIEPVQAAANEREPIVLTVGGIWRENLLRKGLLPFVQAASYLPNVRFVHAGAWNDDSIDALRRAAGLNVEFRGFVTQDELATLYARASVYVQASLHEGFGLSVAEAMSAGCIPVVAARGALPEVVGDCGVYVNSTGPQAVAAGISKALSAPASARTAARNRVLTEFSVTRRNQALVSLLQSTMG
jgi:glycosyltransferase involved in cell wall biosynthesis